MLKVPLLSFKSIISPNPHQVNGSEGKNRNTSQVSRGGPLQPPEKSGIETRLTGLLPTQSFQEVMIPP